jgi:predicted outer membrane protein
MGLTATLAALVFPVWSYADRSGTTGASVLSDQTVTTRYGPLSALDRDFVTRVRLAGLWELPAGQQAEEKGTTAAVRTAGQHLIDGHTFLDERVRDVAARLGLPLPNQPNAQQQQWLATLNAAQGVDFDREFANILRLAHGKVFTVVAQVRATTQNSLVRALADDANTTVLDHIKVLEATGYVDFGALARDMAASSSPVPSVSAATDPGQVVPLAPSLSPTYTLPPAASSPPASNQP